MNQRLIVRAGQFDILRLSHQSLNFSQTRPSISEHMHLSTSTALLKLSDTRTVERNLVASALVAEVSTVAMSKVTDGLAVNDEDPDSFCDFAKQRRWYRDGLRKSKHGQATTHVVPLFVCCERRKDEEPVSETGQKVSTGVVWT